jgi:hypothetical protein
VAAAVRQVHRRQTARADQQLRSCLHVLHFVDDELDGSELLVRSDRWASLCYSHKFTYDAPSTLRFVYCSMQPEVFFGLLVTTQRGSQLSVQRIVRACLCELQLPHLHRQLPVHVFTVAESVEQKQVCPLHLKEGQSKFALGTHNTACMRLSALTAPARHAKSAG